MGVNLAIFCLSAFGVFAFTSAYAGEYIPKSYYVIADGRKLDTVYLRSKRSVLDLLRKKRGVNYSQSGSAPGGGVPFGIPSSPEQFYSQAQEFLNKLPYANGDFNFPHGGGFQGQQGGGGYGSGSGSGAGAYSFSSASSSGSGGSGGYPQQGQGQGNTYSGGGAPGGGHHYSNTGSDGPKIFSRFGEDTGNGVHVSGTASGPNGAFSSSSASTDGNGKVKYSVQTGKY